MSLWMLHQLRPQELLHGICIGISEKEIISLPHRENAGLSRLSAEGILTRII